MPNDQIKLERVRLSFPDIWKAKAVKKDDTPKFAASFLLDKTEHAALIKQIRKTIWSMAVAEFDGEDSGDTKTRALVDKGKLHVCLHEGSEKEYDGYDENNMFITASSPKRPLIVDRDRTQLAEEDGKPYAGCYVNSVVRFWVQNNEWGKRVNAELMGIQFYTDGEAFGVAPLDPDAFEDLTEKDEPPDKEEKTAKGGKGAKKPADKKKGGDGEGGTDDDTDTIPF